MMAVKDDTGKRNGNRWNPIVVAVVSAILGSTGSIAVVFNTPFGQAVVRPDPFTGTQAQALERRLTALEYHVMNHPDVGLRADVAVLRSDILTTIAKQETIIKNQDRILDKLDSR